ncbi:hypothetical protein SHLI107390_16300 [Shewanella livingstonensis]
MTKASQINGRTDGSVSSLVVMCFKVEPADYLN